MTKYFGSLLVFLTILFVSGFLYANECGVPYRFALEQEQEINFQGDEMTLNLQLFDEQGQLVKPCHSLSALLQISDPNGQKSEKKISLPKGIFTKQISAKLEASGLYRFSISNERLYSAVLHLIAKDAKALNDESKSDVVRSASNPNQECPPLELIDRMKPWKVLLLSNATAEGAPANGKHPVSIVALISSEQLYIDHDVEIVLESVGGTLSSPSITIPRCKTKGKVNLTAKKPGVVAVNFKQAIGANMTAEDSGVVEVEFLPPVKGIEIKARDNMSLLDQGFLAVGLVDEEGKPVPSSKHPITLRVSGNARLALKDACEDQDVGSSETNTLCLKENMSHADIQLLPLSIGAVEIDASAAGLGGAQKTIKVTWPLLHLLFAVIGGAIGSVVLLAFHSIRGNGSELHAIGVPFVILLGIIGGLAIYLLSLPFVASFSEHAWLKGYAGAFSIASAGGIVVAVVANFIGLDKWLTLRKAPSLDSEVSDQSRQSINGGVFISYRRSDQPGFAGRLADHLEKAFGSDQVFRDVESIAAGENFVVALNNALDSCDALLVIMGPQWLSEKLSNGKARIFDEGDWVRTEIEVALAKKKRIFPILLDSAKMPSPENLPESLAVFCEFNAHEISDKRWEYDVNELVKELTKG